jgi:hypothetical protein
MDVHFKKVYSEIGMKNIHRDGAIFADKSSSIDKTIFTNKLTIGHLTEDEVKHSNTRYP